MTWALYLFHVQQRQISYSGLPSFISEQFKILGGGQHTQQMVNVTSSLDLLFYFMQTVQGRSEVLDYEFVLVQTLQ